MMYDEITTIASKIGSLFNIFSHGHYTINWIHSLLNDMVSSGSYFHNWVYFTLQLALYKNPSIIQKKGKNDDVSLNYYNCFKNRVISIWFIIFWKEVPIWIWLLVAVLQLHHPPLQFWQWPGLPPAIKIRNHLKVSYILSLFLYPGKSYKSHPKIIQRSLKSHSKFSLMLSESHPKVISKSSQNYSTSYTFGSGQVCHQQ